MGEECMYHGVINVYKEPGFTSHDVVAKLRGILKQKKIGHTGTLDPAACGVLPVCLGHGTRIADMLTEKKKTYEAVLLLGQETDTQDTTGEVLARCPVNVSEEEVRRTAASFIGSQKQVPPMYSALKVEGKKLYELARAGKEVERPARDIQIDELTMNWIKLPRVGMTVTCSKGTYIRTLCHDIGQAAGCGGCMAELTRLRSGQFSVENSLTLAQIEALVREGCLDDHILPVDAFFSDLPMLTLSENLDKLAHNGNTLPSAGHSTYVRVYDSSGSFIGVYEKNEKAPLLKPWKMFYDG